MEQTKNYRVQVKQVDRFSFEFSVSATSEEEAKNIVRKMIQDEPLDSRKNTYVGTDISVELVESPIRVHTVEALFDIDKDITDELVILLNDLSEKQKAILNVELRPDADRESEQTFFVFSSSGSLKVRTKDGVVVECTTDRIEDNELKQITRFDLEEYKKHYNVSVIPGDLDILDLGYWNNDGEYEKPVEDWRNEMRRVE